MMEWIKSNVKRAEVEREVMLKFDESTFEFPNGKLSPIKLHIEILTK